MKAGEMKRVSQHMSHWKWRGERLGSMGTKGKKRNIYADGRKTREMRG